MRVDQLVNSFSTYDAVSNHVSLLRRTVLSIAREADVFVEQDLSLHKKNRKFVHPLTDFLNIDHPNNTVIYHHSIGTSIPLFLQRIKAYKIVIYHNVTPSLFFEGPGGDETFREACAEGIRQLAYLRRFAQEVWTVSRYNQEELLACGFPNVKIVPLLRDYSRLRRGKESTDLARKLAAAPSLVCVGRLTPHKQQLELVRLFADLKKQIPDQLQLFLVGSHLPVYLDRIYQEAVDLGLRFSRNWSADFADIYYLEGSSEVDLATLYKNALVFVTLSIHEGFCVPVVEAAACGLGALSLRKGALVETVNLTQGRLFADSTQILGSLVDICRRRERFLGDARKTLDLFSLDKMQEVYLDLLSHRGGPGHQRV